MKKAQYFGVSLVLTALFLAVGCSNQQSSAPKGGAAAHKVGEASDHTHGTGPHGGVVFDLGGGTYHAEFTVDHPKKEAAVYILGSDAKTPTPVKADILLLSINEPQFQVELKAKPVEGEPKGFSSRFVGNHEQLGKEQEFAGTVSGEIDAKPYAGDFKEEPEPHSHLQSTDHNEGEKHSKLAEISEGVRGTPLERQLFLTPGGL
jgi:hypothetical protein